MELRYKVGEDNIATEERDGEAAGTIVQEEGYHVARVWGDAPTAFDPREVGPLLAAALELLKALEELLQCPNKHRPEHVWEQARRAVAKAHGRQQEED